jgi:hypothetical protein
MGGSNNPYRGGLSLRSVVSLLIEFGSTYNKGHIPKNEMVHIRVVMPSLTMLGLSLWTKFFYAKFMI